MKDLYWYLRTFTFKQYLSRAYIGLAVSCIAAVSSSLGMGLFVPVVMSFMETASNDNFFVAMSSELLSQLGYTNNLSSAIILAAVVMIIADTLTYIAMLIGADLSRKTLVGSRNLITKNIINWPYREVVEERGGVLISAMTEQATLAATSVEAVFKLLTNILIVLAMAVTLSLISIQLTVLAVGIGFFVILSQHKIYGLFRKYWDQWQQHKLMVSAFYSETISGIRTIKQSGKEVYRSDLSEKYASSESDMMFSSQLFFHLSPYYTKMLATIITATIIIIGYYQFEQTGAEILVFLVVIRKLQASVNQANMAWLDLNKSLKNIEIMNDFVNRKIKTSPAIEFKYSFDDIINIENVCFKYDRSGPDVLSGLSLKIKKNKFIALVGKSGAGKSTIIDLISGLHEPQRGSISLDGIDINKINKKDLYEKLSVVEQEGFLFNDTIANNITNGNNVDNDQLVKSSKIAHAHEFIDNMEQKYNTVVGDRGVKLSGGQKQRITLARALYNNPEILILDEATSAVDSKTEDLIRDSISKLHGKLTIIAIAHRMSTILEADTIYYIDDGVVLCKGSHKQLIESCEHYKEVVQRQLISESTA